MSDEARFIALPSDDEEFGREVRAAARRINDGGNSESVILLLKWYLTPGYPSVTIRRRSDLASLTSQAVYYVYRDGDVIGAEQPTALDPQAALEQQAVS